MLVANCGVEVGAERDGPEDEEPRSGSFECAGPEGPSISKRGCPSTTAVGPIDRSETRWLKVHLAGSPRPVTLGRI